MIGRDLPRQKPGRDVWPRTVNRLVRALEDRARGQLLSGYGPVRDARGRRERGFLARLSGASSPYDFAEVYGRLSGSNLAWEEVPGGRSGTAAAHEDNGTAGLDGKVARIRPTGTPGIWRFRFNRKQVTCYWGFTVSGCNSSAEAGATVNLRQGGSLIATGTTDGSGQLTLDVPLDTYDVEVIPATDGYETYTDTVAHTCNQSTSIFLATDADHVCVSCCDVPVAKVLYLPDTEGTHALVHQGGASTVWLCTYLFSGTSFLRVNLGANCTSSTGAMTVTIRFDCSTWALLVQWKAICTCPAFNGDMTYASDGSNLGVINAAVGASGTSISCNPFSVTFSVPTTDTAAINACPVVFPHTHPGGATPGGGGTLALTP